MILLYYLVLIKVWFISYLPFRVIYWLSDLTCFILKDVLKYRRAVILQNLNNAYPDLDEESISKIAAGFYRNMSDVMLETIKGYRISRQQLKERCKIKNPELLERYHREGKSVLMVFGHFCNWEWSFMSVAVQTPQETCAVYKPLSNKHFDRLFLKIRSRFVTRMLPMKSSARTILKHKSENKPLISGLLADQSPTKSESDYWVNFLNQETLVYLGVEKLAKKTNNEVVFIRINRVSRGKYELELVPILENQGSESPHSITDAHVKELEDLIQSNPANWLWSHKRWKHKRNQQAS